MPLAATTVLSTQSFERIIGLSFYLRFKLKHFFRLNLHLMVLQAFSGLPGEPNKPAFFIFLEFICTKNACQATTFFLQPLSLFQVCSRVRHGTVIYPPSNRHKSCPPLSLSKFDRMPSGNEAGVSGLACLHYWATAPALARLPLLRTQ